MKTSELLRKAADEIRRRGWHQGSYGSDWKDETNCSVCSLGAIRAADGGDPWAPSYQHAATRALSAAVGTFDIAIWNDRPERTVEEVLEKFEEAARAAEAEGN